MHDGAYYLAGYAVECAFKACIARVTHRSEFPDKKKSDLSHSHNFFQLSKVAGLEKAFDDQASKDTVFRENWECVQTWSEQSRYSRQLPETAREPWIRQR